MTTVYEAPAPREAAGEGPRWAVELRALSSRAVPTLLGWGVVALVNAVFVTRLDHRSFRIQALHHVYDFGLLLALGWLVFLTEASLEKVCRAPRRPWQRLALLSLSVLALSVLAYFALGEDLSGFEARQAREGSRVPWRLFVSFAAVGVVVAARFVSDRLALTPLSFALLAFGIALPAAAEFALTTGYPGFHLFVAVLSSFLVRSSLVWALSVRSQKLVRPTLSVAALWALACLLIRPPASVWPELFRIQGAALVPFYALVLPDEPEPGPSRFIDPTWYRPRLSAPPVPPSAERLLASAPPAVVLLTVDSLRADVLQKPELLARLPNLSKLRAESVEFTEARSPTPSTYTTFHAIFTGKFFSGTRWTRKNWTKKRELDYFPHTDESPRLSELLGRADVDTISVPSMTQLKKRFGVGKGFRRELSVPQRATAAQTIRALLKQLKKRQEEPFFAALHLMDPHHPYDAGAPDAPEFERYVGEIEVVDREIGRLLARLDEPDLANRTFLIVAADHGEAFGEHSTIHHATTLYEELVRVPLLVRGPGIKPRRISEPVTLVDLAPTVLDVFGLPTPGHFLGQSLVPLLAGRDVRLTRPIAAESSRRARSIVFPDGKKAIIDLQRRTRELYDLRKDPLELDNLIDEPGSDEYFSAVQVFFAAHALPNYEPPWRKF
jgi:arylsulfatase A-like enzyme